MGRDLGVADCLDATSASSPVSHPLVPLRLWSRNNSHHVRAKPSSAASWSGCGWFSTVWPAIGGRDPDVERGSSGCCHGGSVARIGCSQAMIVGKVSPRSLIEG